MFPSTLRNLMRAGSEDEILRILVDAAVTELGAEGAAVIGVLPSGEAKVVASRGLPEAAAAWRAEVDVIDADLGHALLACCGPRFAHARTLPLMSGGDLFGALVVFFPDRDLPSAERLASAEGWCDLAAISLGKARQFQELVGSLTALRATREVLERTEKLRALGEMAAGISHDLKNILNPLSLHLQLLKRILRRAQIAEPGAKGGVQAPGAYEAIAEMEGVLRRGVETLERLRDFSRQTPETRIETVDLDALAHEAIELSRPRIAAVRPRATEGGEIRPSRGVRIVEQLGAPPPIQARSTDLVAALLNLVANAIDALVDGGTVTVTTGAEGGGSWVRVHDDGPGIPADLQARVFEPFFTTKGKEGTGLGLAMVYAFVQRHGGKLTLDSAPDRGTTFMIWFPRHDGEGGHAGGA